MKTVYFDAGWGLDNEEFLNLIKKQSYDGNCRWNTIEAVTDFSKADYHIALNKPTLQNSKTLLFSMEPPCLLPERYWENIDVVSKFPVSEFYKPQHWWVGKSYQELKSMEPLDKNKGLSWITTDKGKNVNALLNAFRSRLLEREYKKFEYKSLPLLTNLVERGFYGSGMLESLNNLVLNHPTDGHLLRMEFFDRLTRRYPGFVDVYGRGDFSGEYYKGVVNDKWDGLAPYRYSLAIENYKGKNYFTEKISDALLAWCMPIYWGCTNLPEFLPEDSYVWIDIEGEGAPEKVKDVVESRRREENLDAIAEARDRILHKYQIWPTVNRAVNKVEASEGK